MKTISIALATYNGSRYIKEQLDSLQHQTMLPIELVACDDASTDNTVELIKAFAATTLFPVKVFVNDFRLGYRSNFMKAASLCEGDLIAFCDQDDIWNPQKLLEVEKRFQKPDVLLVIHNADVMNSSGDILGKVHLSDEKEDMAYEPLGISPWQFPLGFTMTFRRDLLAFSELRNLSLDYFNGVEKLAHDQWIFLLAVAFGQVIRMPDILARYRQHDTNTFGLERSEKTFVFKLKEKFTKFVNFDIYADACERILTVMKEPDLLPLNHELQPRIAASVEFFDRLTTMYRHRYNAYSGKNLFSRVRSWLLLRSMGGYDEDRVCHFEKKEVSRDILLGVVMAGLYKKKHKGPAMDGSLVVTAKP